MKQQKPDLNNKQFVIQPDITNFFKEIDPVIHFCLKKYPTFVPFYQEEMYNAAVVSVLENYNLYDASRGNPLYFVKVIKGGINQFIAQGVYNFSSIDKYKDFLKIAAYFPDIWTNALTEKDYDSIKSKTGLGHLAVDNAIMDACIGGAISYYDEAFIHDYQEDISDLDTVEKQELDDAIHTAMDGLDEEELDFVYDMCGFYGRPLLSERELRKKHHMTQAEYDQYLSSVIRKLKGSRKLRRYIGRKFLI